MGVGDGGWKSGEVGSRMLPTVHVLGTYDSHSLEGEL